MKAVEIPYKGSSTGPVVMTANQLNPDPKAYLTRYERAHGSIDNTFGIYRFFLSHCDASLSRWKEHEDRRMNRNGVANVLDSDCCGLSKLHGCPNQSMFGPFHSQFVVSRCVRFANGKNENENENEHGPR